MIVSEEPMADVVKASTAATKAGRPAELRNEPESPKASNSSRNVLQTEHPPVGTRSPRSMAEAAVIAVLGQTGSGKSYFIQKATRDDTVVVGHSFASETAGICAYRTEIDGNSVVLVDTIGFDDSYRSDATVLREIATWLAKTYAEGIRMAGILYMQNIDTERVTGSAVKNLRAFKKILGADAMESTIFVANKWDKIAPHLGQTKLAELMETPDFWGAAIQQGATVERYLGTHEDAQRIVRSVLRKERTTVLNIQQELIDKRLELPETEAGKTLLEEINRLKASQIKEMTELRSTIRGALDFTDLELYLFLCEMQCELQNLESSEAEILELKSKNRALEEFRGAYDERIAQLEESFENRLHLIVEQGLPPPPPYSEPEGHVGSRGSLPSNIMGWMSRESSWARATLQFFRKLLRPRLRAGHRRLEWKCTCGEILFGDFQETTSGSLDKLAASLKEYSEQGSQQGEPSQLQTPTKAYTRRPFGGRGNNPGENRGNNPIRSNQVPGTKSSNQPAHPVQTRQALQLCIETGKYTLELNEVDLHGPCTDGKLFERIRERYELSSRHILPLRMWFWKPEKAIFVKFRLGQLPFVSPIAGTIESPVIPPEEEVSNGKYVYTPCPIEEIPMDSRTFFHHFYSPASKHPYAFWGMRLPRKLGPKLGPMTQGWGIHLEERPDWSLFTLLMFILLLLSGLIAGLYSWRTGDHQSGIAIGAWLTSVQAMGIAALLFWWK